jgi:hypothetical protein
MNDFLVRLKGGSLTSEQSSVMLELLMGERDNTSKIENVDRSKIVALPRPGASREEIEKLKAELQKNTDLRNAELLALAQEKNKRLEEILLPHQVREVEVLIRLHNICVFGVKRGVLSYLRSRELEVDHEKLNKSIEALHDDLEKHCLETQTEIESLMLTVTAEDDTIGNLLFNRKSWDFDPELPPMQYELLFYGLIAR